MISKSTKKSRRKKTLVNENRARLSIHSVEPRVDFWLVGIQRAPSSVNWLEIIGKQKAIKTLRRLSSMMGSKTYKVVIQFVDTLPSYISQ
jgi:hypothetical protein